MEILEQVGGAGLDCAVVVITAHGSINVAVNAMRAGAIDFLVKPFTGERLIYTVRNALERRRLAQIVETYEEDIARTRFCGFIGGSLPMQATYRTIESAASSKATVFITGENGTGKELAAEAVHNLSPRNSGPFVVLNCGAIPKDLMESEIFGHVRGAFTGATADRDGAAKRADGGTLFLDEICEMDLNLQTKLLRFIQAGSLQRVGGGELEKVDVRFVCATNQDPAQAIEKGRLREDLYYRLHVIPIQLPALRERGGDVMLIANAFLSQFAGEEGKHFSGFTADVEAVLENYPWPGNVRQMLNVIRNVTVLHDGDLVTLDMLPDPLGLPGGPADRQPGNGAIRPLWQIEKDAIEHAIAACQGNIPKAAVLLGISASTIYRKKQTWIDDP